MSLPFFYLESLNEGDSTITLGEETSKHVVQVLRMQNGEQLLLTNGKGLLINVEIIDNHRKRCVVSSISSERIPLPEKNVQIAISPLKNNSRFEWFLEKAAEIGVRSIVPVMCKRTEKQQLRTDRLKGILISAMLQSKQAWLCELHEPVTFSYFVEQAVAENRLIAHCEPEKKASLNEIISGDSSIILIGPEGDFTSEEIVLSLKLGFMPVTLGNNRLRTETAGLAAAVKLCIQ